MTLKWQPNEPPTKQPVVAYVATQHRAGCAQHAAARGFLQHYPCVQASCSLN